MSDNDSDEPIGRRNSSSRTKSRSSGSKKKNHPSAKNKSKRKIISSDEENVEEVVVKKPEKQPTDIHRLDTLATDIIESSKLTEPSSLSPIIGTTLEPPSFSPLLKGPPSPRHHNESLKWKHKVNLLGEKVVDPMIHICDKCHLPILIYARMIPCKHVFCLECGRAADKLCHKCNEKVSRVEQTTLGKVFMCTHQQSKTREICKRTYLSQRDLQAHIAHRHVKCKEKEKPIAAPVTRDPRSVHPLPVSIPSSAALQRVSTPSTVAALTTKVVPFNPPPPAPPLPPIPALTGPVPPSGPPTPYLTPPPVYAPQMVPAPSAVYTGAQYPPVPTAVHAPPAFVHAPHPQAYSQPPPPPPPASYAPPPPASYEDFRGAPPPPPSHWQQRPPPRDYRAPPQGYYRQ